MGTSAAATTTATASALNQHRIFLAVIVPRGYISALIMINLQFLQFILKIFHVFDLQHQK
ncbi:hypothetical protein M3558_05540 [Brevibacillus invocatus]|nr:hypothetical protein [Brevibacillus invocatus]